MGLLHSIIDSLHSFLGFIQHLFDNALELGLLQYFFWAGAAICIPVQHLPD